MNTIAEIITAAPIPRLEAEVLLADSLNVDRSFLIKNSSSTLTPTVQQAYLLKLNRRLAGEPIAYITGKKEFFGHQFFVNRDVLIPRPESEGLIELASKKFNTDDPLSIIDVGTGSGCLALSLSLLFPKSNIKAVDISPLAFKVAKANKIRLNPSAQLEFLESDLLDQLSDNLAFDLIVANLPYIATDEESIMAKETLDYEPYTALFSEESGLNHYRRLFEQIVAKKIKCKTLLCEIGLAQGESISQLSQQVFANPGLITYDLANKPRYFILDF